MQSKGHSFPQSRRSGVLKMEPLVPFVLTICVLCLCPQFAISANPNYSYRVDIADPNQANFQQKGETRLGEKAEGFYSVIEPDGRLRTVTYVSDEHGFRPTVTYSYPEGLAPQLVAKVVQPSNALIQTEPLAYPQAYAAGPIYKGVQQFQDYVAPQYAASYSTPVFTVKERRHFYKTEPLGIIPSPIVQAVAPVQTFGIAAQAPLVQAVAPVQTFAITGHAPVVKAVAPVQTLAIAPQAPLIKAVAPIRTLAIAPQLSVHKAVAPVQSTVLAAAAPPVVIKTKVRRFRFQAPQNSGYTYPVPEIKLGYPLPPTTTVPPPPPTTTPEPVKVLPTEAPGYSYPVPQKKLEYPEDSRTEVYKPSIETLLPPPPITETVVQAVPPQDPLPAPISYTEISSPHPVTPVQPIIAAKPFLLTPEPRPVNAVKPLLPAPEQQSFHYIHYGNRLPKIPVHAAVYNTAPVPAPLPQNVFIQTPPPQPIVYQQPQIQYTHAPAQVFHRQVHFPKVQPLINVQPVAPPVVQQTYLPAPLQEPIAQAPLVEHRYEDIVAQNLNQMRYGTVPVPSYLPPLANTLEGAQVVQAVAAPPTPTVTLLNKGRVNPLTFNYGYDNGVSRVSHSYYGSGW